MNRQKMVHRSTNVHPGGLHCRVSEHCTATHIQRGLERACFVYRRRRKATAGIGKLHSGKDHGRRAAGSGGEEVILWIGYL